MLKTILLSMTTIVLLILGLVGLLVPVLPGVLLLLGAAFCASAVSPVVRRRLHRNPVLRRFHHRWQVSQGLALCDRLKLMFWLSADTAIGSLRRQP